jgi:hypothetical protein
LESKPQEIEDEIEQEKRKQEKIKDDYSKRIEALAEAKRSVNTRITDKIEKEQERN